ncbi:DNA polymerase III subunit delta' [Lysobacter korlensis]|uniref:DNA-directed DNA polymerase n=1 Tax=Lysobacter korlensis TaxID=553636 RepID=A0ABV6RKT2_9GAMM
MTVFAPWQQRVYDQLVASADAGRLGHGLLFSGPARLGKAAVAERLAQRLLCERPSGGEPCGRCRGCLLLAAGTHPDFHRISFVPNKEGTRLRTEIVIEQIRRLSEQLSLTPQYGGAQVAIIDPADAINNAACNALLKTLEEPVAGRYLWLITAHPARLPATIRSRCQRVAFAVPGRTEALQWLRDAGHSEDTAIEALDAARGHPGLAREWLEGEGLALRRQVAQDLEQVARGQVGVVETAQRWVADEHAASRLGHAADLAVVEAARLTEPGRVRSLGDWFDRANRTRDLLRTTVRADLAVVELLMAWRTSVGRHETGGAAAGGRRR